MQLLLEDFCLASGLRINKAKTSVFFSRNIPPHHANGVCTVLGFQKTDQLGRYLGVPILHKRVTKDTYRFIVEKVQGKLQGWKAATLSLAGRITLAQSVLSNLPYYTMQTARLPSSTCSKIQSIIKDFIWGTTDQRKGVHLIKWSTMCQPKSCGGCGMEDLSSQNTAFLMKLGYAVITQPHALWVQVLRSKYNWNQQKPMNFCHHNASHLWKSLSAIRDDLTLGCLWHIGDGKTARFWSDHWIGDLGPLSHQSFCPLSEIELQRPVCDFVTQEGNWNWNEFQSKLPNDALKHFNSFKPPQSLAGQDSIIWRHGSKFSVRSAYDSLTQDCWNEDNDLWNLAWSWNGPQRIKTFLWLVLNNRLLTNMERMRRHISDTADCEICWQGPEDIDHVLRKCVLARECWSLVVPPHNLQTFLTMPFSNWLQVNLKDPDSNPHWCTFFGILCWRLWSARNCTIFRNEDITASRLINVVLAFTDHTIKACLLHNSLPHD